MKFLIGDVMRGLTLLRAAEEFFLCTQMNHSERGLEKYKVCLDMLQGK